MFDFMVRQRYRGWEGVGVINGWTDMEHDAGRNIRPLPDVTAKSESRRAGQGCSRRYIGDEALFTDVGSHFTNFAVHRTICFVIRACVTTLRKNTILSLTLSD